MTQNVDNTQMLSLTFPDIMTKLYLTWESSEKEKQELHKEITKYKTHLDEITTSYTELLKSVETLQNINSENEKEITQLKKKVEDAEDEQKQFRKVSRILTMDRENSNYKQQSTILERRVAFYQNQCNSMKSLNSVVRIDQQTDTDDLYVDNNTYDNEQSNIPTVLTDTISIIKTPNHINESDIITYNDNCIDNKETDNNTSNDKKINVKEKKIKGVIYYVDDDGDIYVKNDDDSIGELKGKIEHLSSGKTKVKWYKL